MSQVIDAARTFFDQLASVGATWDARLNRIKRIAERIQRGQDG